MKRSYFVPLVVVLSACNNGPVRWEDSTILQPTLETALEPQALMPPASPGRCTASVVSSRLGQGGYAAWWSLRSDSTADIVASSTTDGVNWTTPARLDTADVARKGCDRPPPAIAVDGDNLHVVYSMTAREGPGIFLAHSMDRARTFHSPVAVVYGERPALASVSAAGNFVIVAFEDPNTTPTRVSVAISSTMAHLFEFRETVSPPDAAATAPTVSVVGRDVTVWWAREGGDGRRVGRRGTIR